MVVPKDQFNWLSGQNEVRKFISETGFKSHFCCHCGSPLPNLTRNDQAWWVPVGLLEDHIKLELGAHLFIDSKASWETIAKAGEHFDQMPNSLSLDRILGENALRKNQ